MLRTKRVASKVKLSRGNADFVEFVPTGMLADTALENPTKRKRKGAWSSEGGLLYDGFEGLLVRTMLLRSDQFTGLHTLPTLESPEDIWELCRHLASMDREHIVVLCINPQNQVVAIHESSIGLVSRAETTAQLLLKAPILSNAAAVILVHNHPGGSPTPSKDDVVMAKTIQAAGRCVGISLLDSVVVAEKGFYSLQAHGLL